VADVFVSYSRRDAEFAARLAAELEQRGKAVWMDVDGIRDAELFPVALRRAIESSDAFVFVISPDAVRSPFCEQEIAHAAELNKRIVPVAWREVPDSEIPEEVRHPHLVLRLGGHLGPVFPVLDPIIDTNGFMGSHVSRTARIEPVTPPGEVYVTEAFAATLLLSANRGLTCDYVGHMAAAKGYDNFRMYRLRRTTGGDEPLP
jgi:TIR domain